MNHAKYQFAGYRKRKESCSLNLFNPFRAASHNEGRSIWTVGCVQCTAFRCSFYASIAYSICDAAFAFLKCFAQNVI